MGIAVAGMIAPGALSSTPAFIQCPGDCDDSGAVSVNELVLGVNIALARAAVESCLMLDADGSGSVTVNELVSGVGNALSGCPPRRASATPTPVASMPPATASATPVGSAPSPSRTPTPTATSGHATATRSSTPPPSVTTPTPTATQGQPTATRSSTARPSVTPTRTPTVPAPSPSGNRLIFCSPSGTVPIPDNDPGGVGDEFTINQTGRIADLDVRLEIDHSWVGDLAVDLEHVDTGSYAIVVDRPIDPSTQRSCAENNVSAILDDEASADVDLTCADEPPAISGRVRPTEPISLFDGEAIGGVWSLVIVDDGPLDSGALRQWCLEFTRR